MNGEIIIHFRTERPGAVSLVDALDQVGFLAVIDDQSPGSPDVIVEARCWEGEHALSPERVADLIQLAQRALSGLPFAYVGNGVEGGVVQPVLDPHRIITPLVGTDTRMLETAPNELEIWELLRLVSSDRSRFIAIAVTIPAAEIDSAWSSYKAFVRQADTYYRAATSMDGSAAALLYYYSFLNLAKAELCQWRPSSVAGAVKHGIGSQFAGGMEDWTVTSYAGGVFPLLYEKRVGRILPEVNRKISALTLFRRCAEVSFELEEAGYGPHDVCSVYAGVFTNGARSWAQLLGVNYDPIRNNEPTHLAVLEVFDERPHLSLRDIQSDFAFSSRKVNLDVTQLLWSERWKDVQLPGNQMLLMLKSEEWVPEILNALNGIVEPPAFGFEGLLLPSISESELVPLPSGLARYAAMFLVSSLVRYAPSTLQPDEHPRQAYYLDSFTRQSPVRLLADFVSNMVSPALLYYDTAART